MGVFDKFTKLQKNNKFDYTARYYKNESDGSPYKFEHKFDKFRSTATTTRGLRKKLGNAMADVRKEGDRNHKIRFLIILTVLLFIFLYIIDFDLSIFYSN